MRTTTAESKKTSRGRAGPDAIALLKADHAAVKKMFKEYKKLCEGDARTVEKSELASQICMELTVHATLEEEIFYPALRAALEEQDLLDEAEVEHASAKDLIAQIEQMEPGAELYDAKVTVLGEYINHHVEEEEGEMFKQARKAEVDLRALGDEMATRQQELKAELGLDAEDDESEESDEEIEDDEDGATPAKSSRKKASKRSH